MHLQNRFSIQGFAIWVICVAFFLYEFLLRTVIGTFQAPLMSDIGLNTLQFSMLSSTVFMLIYSIMQIPAGMIITKSGLKTALLLGAITCTISTFGVSYATTYESAILYRVLMAFGSSFGFICLLVGIAQWMPLKRRAMLIGVSQFVGTIGPMIAGGPMDAITSDMLLSWRDIFLMLTMVGVILTFLIFFIVEDSHKKFIGYAMPTSFKRLQKATLQIFKASQPWFIAIYSGVIYCALEYLAENEGRTFLMLKGIGVRDAAYMISYSWLGYAIGCPILGSLSDHIKQRKSVMLLAALIGLGSIILLVYSNHHISLLAGFIGIGIGASGQSITFATVAEQCEKRYMALGVGVNNTLIGVIAAANVFIISNALDAKSLPLDIADYQDVFSILIVLAIAGAIVAAFFIKETHCKFVEKLA